MGLSLVTFFPSCSSTLEEANVTKKARSSYAGISGEWVGVYLEGRKPMKVTLLLSDVETEGDRPIPIEGSLAIEALGKTSSSTKPDCPVSLDYSPFDETFSWRLSNREGRKSGLARLLAVAGVVDLDGQRLVGNFSERGQSLSEFIFFSRPDQFPSVVKQFSEYGSRRQPSGFSKLKGLFSSTPSLDEMKPWANEFALGHPGETMYTQRALGLKAIPLFTSPGFKKAFGARFQDLDGAALREIHDYLRKETFNKRDPELKELYAVNQMIRVSGTPSAIDTYIGVLCFEGIESWEQSQLRKFDKARGTSLGWNAAESTLATLKEKGPHTLLWPADLSAMTAAAGECRIASSAAKAEELLIAAEAVVDPMQRLGALWSWPGDLGSGRSPNPDRVALLFERRHSALTATLTIALVPYRKSLAGLPTGAEGLEMGIEWLEDCQETFGPYLQKQPFQDLYAEFLATREQCFVASKATIMEEVAAAAPRSLGRLGARWFPLGLDRKTEVWEEFTSTVELRQKELLVEYKQLSDGALAIASESSDSPLRFINFTSYPASHVYEYLYYGFGNPLDDVPRSRRLSAEVGLRNTLRSLFLTYHDEFERRFGNTSVARAGFNDGKEWVEIRNTTQTKNGWGTVISSTSTHHSWVRPRYSDAYIAAMPTTGDLVGGFLIKMAEDEKAKQLGEGQVTKQELMDFYLSGFERSKGVKELLDRYSSKFPGTVKHFEENLFRALTGKQLLRIDVLELRDLTNQE